MFDIEYYEKEDGTFPAEEFLLSLEPKMQAKMFREIELLEEYGNQLREPHSKMLDDGIFEIRAKVSSDITLARCPPPLRWRYILSISRGYNPLLIDRLATPTLATLNDGASPLLYKNSVFLCCE